MPDQALQDRLLTVVISAGQSRNPEKRELEQGVATELAKLAGVEVLNIPHLYDLPANSKSFQTLRELDSDLLIVSWLYDRAAHWVLDRNDIRGQAGEVELKQDTGEDEEDSDASEAEAAEETVSQLYPRPQRRIYCVDFRASASAADYVAEVQRILSEKAGRESEQQFLSIETLERFAEPQNDTYVGAPQPAPPQVESPPTASLLGNSGVTTIDEHPGRRWYPVIDFSRCTNCMECIDFCLFGVYGIDSVETIVVEQADNCRKGCPACSRVCPQNAIIFPQHKTPAIAGAPIDSEGLKIDLSKLFGAPDTGEDAATIAARERDEQLILAGREAVGAEDGKEEPTASESIQARIAEGKSSDGDELDSLLDELDALDL